MSYEITDNNGERIDLGSLVEVNETWKKNPSTKVGVVREMTFRDDSDPTVKVSGVMNRNLKASEVTVLNPTKSERALLNAFLGVGVTPTMGAVREILAAMASEGTVSPTLE